MSKAIHYAGEIQHSNGHVLPGWAACCSGDKAVKIRANGSHTYHRGQVTCKACQKMIAKHDAWAAPCPTCEGRGPTDISKEVNNDDPNIIMLDTRSGRVIGCGYGEGSEMTCNDCYGGNGACDITRELWSIRGHLPDPYA